MATSRKSAAPAKSATPAKKSAAPAAKSAAPKTAAPKAATSKAAAPSKAVAAKPTSMAKSAKPAASKNKYAFSDNDLKKIMLDSLKDIYYAEKQLHKALGKMAKAAYNPSLQNAFLTHQQETESQIRMVEDVFGMMGEKVKSVKCPAMDGLLKEANEHIEEYSKGPGRDACLIEGAQKVEHYEMAAYGTMRTFAQVLGLSDVQNALQTILDQEGATDKKLTELAVSINEEALRAHRESNNDD